MRQRQAIRAKRQRKNAKVAWSEIKKTLDTRQQNVDKTCLNTETEKDKNGQ
jgi:hypothetical protein